MTTFEHQIARMLARIEAEAGNRRVRCGAKTRKRQPCKNPSEPGKRRCKFHGGRSTGPKTDEGKARIAEAQRRRWAQYREDKDWEACAYDPKQY